MSFVGPGSSSSCPRASPLFFHLLNATAEWGETSSSHSPLYGKLFLKKPQKILTGIWEKGNFTPLPNNPDPGGGSLAGLRASPAGASQQTSQANRVLSLASSPGLLVGPAGMKLSPPVLLNPSLPPPFLSHPTPFPEVPQAPLCVQSLLGGAAWAFFCQGVNAPFPNSFHRDLHSIAE